MLLHHLDQDRHYRFFEAAHAVALSGPGAGGSAGYRLGAVLVYRKQILAARFNSLRTHPELLRFSSWPFLHAESACILSHGMNNCAGCKLYVVRIKRDNSLAIAKPCIACQQLIKEVDITEIHYTIGEDNGHGRL